MAKVHAGRYTAKIDGDFVVFLIGMRVNRWWQPQKWIKVAGAMPRMLTQLYQQPELGFLGGENFFRLGPLTSCLLAYWRSFDQLERFARGNDYTHLPAWKEFNQLIGADGSVDIWHETYLVQSGLYETLYGNMPRFGLARAGEHLPVSGRRESARDRLRSDRQVAG